VHLRRDELLRNRRSNLRREIPRAKIQEMRAAAATRPIWKTTSFGVRGSCTPFNHTRRAEQDAVARRIYVTSRYAERRLPAAAARSTRNAAVAPTPSPQTIPPSPIKCGRFNVVSPNVVRPAFNRSRKIVRYEFLTVSFVRRGQEDIWRVAMRNVCATAYSKR